MQLHWKCSVKVERSSWGLRVENMIVHLLLDCSSTWNTIVLHQFQSGIKIDPGTYHNHKGSHWGHTPFDYKHHWWGGEILGRFISYVNVRVLDWFKEEFNSPQLPFAACPVKLLSDFSEQSGSVATEKGKRSGSPLFQQEGDGRNTQNSEWWISSTHPAIMCVYWNVD